MKICEGWSSAGWYVACALLCVCAHPARNRHNEMYISSSRSFDPKSTPIGYGLEEEVSASKSSEIAEDNLEKFEEKRPIMRAITTKAKSNVVLLPLIIEPEAEMLPPGYKGVKPPGVSHMELAFAKPQTGSLGHRSATLRTLATDEENPGKSDGFDRDGDAHYAASKQQLQTQVARDRGSDSIVVLEVGLKTNSEKEKKKTEYTEASGKLKDHSENEDHTNKYKEDVVEKKKATYEAGDDRKKAHNAAGYRNVYHKKEFKKDADFYDNGRQGGHFEKHGRYGEKHIAAEDAYAKGKSNSSRLV